MFLDKESRWFLILKIILSLVEYVELFIMIVINMEDTDELQKYQVYESVAELQQKRYYLRNESLEV